jgi:hypothetical protein
MSRRRQRGYDGVSGSSHHHETTLRREAPDKVAPFDINCMALERGVARFDRKGGSMIDTMYMNQASETRMTACLVAVDLQCFTSRLIPNLLSTSIACFKVSPVGCHESCVHDHAPGLQVTALKPCGRVQSIWNRLKQMWHHRHRDHHR